MAQYDSYQNKQTPADADSVLICDSATTKNKQTLFSGIYNWLQAKIHALTASTSAWGSYDKVLVDRDGTLARIDYSLLAKAIIEEYSGSSLAGVSQSVKAVLDSPMNIPTSIPSNSDLDDYHASGSFYCSSSTIGGTLSHNPAGSNSFILIVLKRGANNTGHVTQIVYTSNKSFTRIYSSGAWGDWYRYEGMPMDMTAYRIELVGVPTGYVHTFNLSNSGRYLLLGITASSSQNVFLMVAVSSTGGVVTTEIYKGDNVTITKDTRTLTITRTDNAIKFYAVKFSGSLTLEEPASATLTSTTEGA